MFFSLYFFPLLCIDLLLTYDKVEMFLVFWILFIESSKLLVDLLLDLINIIYADSVKTILLVMNSGSTTYCFFVFGYGECLVIWIVMVVADTLSQLHFLLPLLFYCQYQSISPSFLIIIICIVYTIHPIIYPPTIYLR